MYSLMEECRFNAEAVEAFNDLLEAAKAMLATHTINEEATEAHYLPGWLDARRDAVRAIKKAEEVK